MKKSWLGKILIVSLALLLNAQSAFAIVESTMSDTQKSETMKKYEELKKEWESLPYEEKSVFQSTELKMLQEKMKNNGEKFSNIDFNIWSQNKFLGNSFAPKEIDRGLQEVLDILLGTRAIEESIQTDSIGNNRNPTGEENIDISSITQLEIASHDYEKMIQDEGLTEKIKIPALANLAPADAFFVSFESEKLLEFSNVVEKYTKDFSEIYTTNLLPQVKTAIMKRLGLPENEQFLKLTSEIAFVSEDLDFLGRTDFALIVKFKDSNSQYIAKMLQTGENAFEQVGDFFVFASHKNLLERIKKTYQEKSSSLAESKDFQYALGSLDLRKNGIVYFSDAFIRKLTSPSYRINARRKNTIFNELSSLQYVVFAYKDFEGSFPKTFSEIVEKNYLSPDQKSFDESYKISDEGEVSHAQWGTLLSMTPVSRVQIEKISQSEKDLYERFRTQYNQFFREFFDPIGIAVMVSDRIAFQTIILPLIDDSEYNWVKAIFGGNAEKPFDFLEHPDRETAFSIMSKLSFDDYLDMVGKEMAGNDPNDNTRRNDLSKIKSGAEQSYGDDQAYPIKIETIVERFYLSEIPTDPETGEEYGYEVYDLKGVEGQCYRLSTQLKGINGESEMENDGGKDPNLFELGNCLQDSEHTFAMASPLPTQKTKSEKELREERIRGVEDSFRKEFSLSVTKNEERLFDFIGDEVMFGMGESTKFSENDLSLLDIFVGIELSNPEKAKSLLETIFKEIGKGHSSEFRGLFSSNKPIKNTYHEKEFYMIPLGGFFGINIFYIFEGNRLYITISQNAINQIIDGMGKEKSFSDTLQRTMAFTGTAKNILLLADFEKFKNLFINSQEIEDSFSKYLLMQSFSQNVAILSEAWKIEKILNPSATEFAEAKKWYPNLPSDFYGLPFVIDPKTLELAIQKDNQIIPVKNIQYGYNSYEYEKKENGKKQDLLGLLKGKTIANPLQKIIENMKSFGIGFAFTQHGLDVRVAFSNPLSSEVDQNFSTEKTDALVSHNGGTNERNQWGIVFAIGGIVLVFGVVFFLSIKRRRSNSASPVYPEAPKAPLDSSPNLDENSEQNHPQ